MNKRFKTLEDRLLKIESLLIDIKHPVEAKLYSVKGISEYAGVSELTVRNWIIEGKIEAKRIGRRILIDQNQFEKGLSEVKSLKYKRIS